MKTIEEIENEYQDFKVESTFVTSLDEFLCFIEIGIDDTKEHVKELLKEMKINSRQQKLIEFKNFFFLLFQQEVIGLYKEDNQILEEIIEFTQGYANKFRIISSLATKDNFFELTKLVDFSCKYYSKHIEYFESRRDALEYSCSGFNYFNGKCVNEIDTFDSFFARKIESVRKTNENNYGYYKVKNKALN